MKIDKKKKENRFSRVGILRCQESDTCMRNITAVMSIFGWQYIHMTKYYVGNGDLNVTPNIGCICMSIKVINKDKYKM